MQVLRSSSWVALGALGALGLFACSHLVACSQASSAPEVASADDGIVGGVDAKGHGLDAVGSIVAADDTETLNFCNGTLIGPKLVLTSKRCAIQEVTPDDGGPGTVKQVLVDKYPLYFITGADIASPSHKIRIESVDVCLAPETGGVDGFGCNVALYRLKEAITDIPPLPFTDRALGVELVGKRFSTLSYGDTTQDVTTQTVGKRHAGSLTLRAVSGAPMKALFPTAADLVAMWAQTEGPDSAAQLSSALAVYYESTLQPDLEAWLGGGAGDAQTCLQDQGAPLLAKDAAGKLTVYAVGSNAIAGTKTKCVPFGAPYAMLGAPVQALIGRNLVDVCANETAEGRCDGDVAVRCTTPAEGERRLTRTDCSALLQHCAPASAENPQASCAD